MNENKEIILDIQSVSIVYDKLINALEDVSIEVYEGEILAVLGANGAGKTSLLKSLCGLLKPQTGSVKLHGLELIGMPANKIIKKEIAYVPEGRMIIPHFSVKENLLVGGYTNHKNIPKKAERVLSLFPILKSRYKQSAGTLSGGEQQMLAIGRALMSDPKILLLDEPSLGLAPIMVDKVMQIVQQINREQGTTVILVEQNAFAALKMADRAYVLENGKITMSGDADVLMKNEELKKKYLAG